MISTRIVVISLVGALSAALASACNSGPAADPTMPVVMNTFHTNVEPILQNRCQSCHHPGGIAPFSLMTYADVVTYGEQARLKVQAREMPPWGAFDDESCKVNHPFKDDLRMTDDEIHTFVDWVDMGMVEGDASKAPAAHTFAATGLIDKTNAYTMAQAHEVDAGGTDDIRCFPMDPGFTQDTWIAASNVVPGDPRVVHHVIVYVDPKGEGAGKVDASGSYPCFGGPDTSDPSLLLAWAPGVPPAYYGEDAGVKVPANAHLIMQVHYHPHPEITANDKTSFELKVLSSKPSFVSQVLLAGNADSTSGLIHLVPPSGSSFLIPANADAHLEAMEITIPEVNGGSLPPMSILTVGSHMHWAGVDMKLEITRVNPSDGQPAHECLLGTPKYDFNWQRGYTYDEPYENLPVVSTGDTIRMTCKYNNTLANKNIAKALTEQRIGTPRDIHLGETTLDEMCLGAIVVVRRATAAD